MVVVYIGEFGGGREQRDTFRERPDHRTPPAIQKRRRHFVLPAQSI
jgi:hypothetical protein